MSYVFFQNILKFLGKRINYEAVANLAGNSFAKNAFDAIEKANPLIKESKGKSVANFFSNVNFTKITGKKEDVDKQTLNGMDWITIGDMTSSSENNSESKSEDT